MNEGKVEQAGAPRDLYEQPETEFVMSFVGPVNKLGDTFIRPHDLDVMLEPNGSTKEAMVDRVVHLGFEVRVELALPDGEHLWAQLTRVEAEALELENGIDRLRQAEPPQDLPRRPAAHRGNPGCRPRP